MEKIKTVQPYHTYDGLKNQFYAMRNLLISKESELQYYQKRVKEFDTERIFELESLLESEKEMNAILTAEIEKYENVSDRLSKSLGEVDGNAYEIVFQDGRFWINHKEVGSGEPLKQWVNTVIGRDFHKT